MNQHYNTPGVVPLTYVSVGTHVLHVVLRCRFRATQECAALVICSVCTSFHNRLRCSFFTECYMHRMAA